MGKKTVKTERTTKTLPDGRVVVETKTITTCVDENGKSSQETKTDVKIMEFESSEKKPKAAQELMSSQKTKSSQPIEKNSAKISNPNDFLTEGLDEHNKYRKAHKAPPLTLDQKLCDFAQEWADELARSNRFEHRPSKQCGENLYTEWSSKSSKETVGVAKKAVDSWYSEVKDYDFKGKRVSMGTGHFTQMVWKSSQRLGMAHAKSPDGKTTIVVANYEPAGNFVGKFVENVLPSSH